MLKNYFGSIKSAFKNPKERYKPEMIRISAMVIAFVFIFICFSVYRHPLETPFSFHFYLEEGAVTILSVTLLTCASLLAYAAFIAAPSKDKRQKIFLLVVALALTFFAMDEVLKFHEYIGDSLDATGFLKVIFKNTDIRRWNDLIIILYGAVALPFLLYFLPAIVQIPYFAECFIIAFLSFVCHTTIDAFVNPTTPSQIIEESFKLYTSTFILLGLIAALLDLTQSKVKKS